MAEQRKTPAVVGEGQRKSSASYVTTVPADVHNLLGRLDKVRVNGKDRWMACCPAHDDRTPSLSIKDDGHKLSIHCFAGCHGEDIMAAVGLTLADLYSKSSRDDWRRAHGGRRPLHRDVLETLGGEALLIAIAAERMAKGAKPNRENLDRIWLAASRFRAAAREVGYDR